ncbi:hypothetical protein AAMO2058_000068200 [Amorphochlora amoebiformis]|mmetsp:Transcript_21939/g.34567  ORF Transcript_21939/g.34567 Transcript_21939/m.34567 type:complete len:593 (-) Transcript_21939:5-1783(-)
MGSGGDAKQRMKVGLGEALIAGGIAGTVVDVSLFPIDTLKTRLQSSQGFQAAGGFKNVYSGLYAVLLGSAPNAAMFFATYEVTKTFLQTSYTTPLMAQCAAGAVAAVASCTARVPADNAKQKVQAGRYLTTTAAIRGIYKKEGFRGFFVGFRATVLREMPFSVVQFTVWEQLKWYFQTRSQRRITAWESGLCGSLAGALAAAITTPIDVLKTRQMIGETSGTESAGRALYSIYKREGISGLFSGFIPRVQLCFFGGLLFFSAYDFSLSTMEKTFPSFYDSYTHEVPEPKPRPTSIPSEPKILGSSPDNLRQEACAALPPTIPEALFAGGVAGVCVDSILFPLDTIKTRLQARQGFRAAGGFNGVYRGLGAAILGSAPIASLFFGAYEATKHGLEQRMGVPKGEGGWGVHMIAGMVGETFACVMVVPTENVKQKVQAGMHKSTVESLRTIIRAEGPKGLYRGYSTTVLREVPFSIIQYPIWEGLKHQVREARGGCAPASWESGMCGAVAGAIAATLTTPLDVAKTRLMLRSTDRYGRQYAGTFDTIARIVQQDGVRALFSGVAPRIQFNVLGGLVFFSAYEKALGLLRETLGS